MTTQYDSLYKRIRELACLAQSGGETIKIIDCLKSMAVLRHDYITEFPNLAQEEKTGLALLLDQTKALMNDKLDVLKTNDFIKSINRRI